MIRWPVAFFVGGPHLHQNDQAKITSRELQVLCRLYENVVTEIREQPELAESGTIGSDVILNPTPQEEA